MRSNVAQFHLTISVRPPLEIGASYFAPHNSVHHIPAQELVLLVIKIYLIPLIELWHGISMTRHQTPLSLYTS
jgi:hypothetical protein